MTMAPTDTARKHHSASPWITWFCRILYPSVMTYVLLYPGYLQTIVDVTWSYIRTSYVFSSAYFETWWVIVTYAMILVGPFAIDNVHFFEKYKIESRMSWRKVGLIPVIMESIEYAIPLMILDTFTVKKYDGVDPEELRIRRQSWIQVTRALPVDPPTVAQIASQLVLSLIIYDAIFYCIHVTMHKNMWLYKNLHAAHHDHDFVHSRVTNQLSVAERILLVLSANQALKIVHGHPLTRAIFVVCFVAWLTENHSGYDLPWTLDKVIPFGIIGGSRYHREHHIKGSGNYQPFFTYIDRFMNRNKSKTNQK